MKKIPLYDVRKIRDLRDMLQQSVELYGDKPAFLVKVKSENTEEPPYVPVSYRKYQQDVEALGTVLCSGSGLGLKDMRIAVIGENRYEWAVSYLAAVNGTGVVVPLDKELPVQELESLINRSKAQAVIYSKLRSEDIRSIRSRLKHIHILIDMDAPEDSDFSLSFQRLLVRGREMAAQGDVSFTASVIDPGTLRMLLFTSGTTDTAKAVMLSHANVCANLEDMCSMLYIGQNDTFLSLLPMHHTYECTCGFLCQIYRGSTIAFCEGLRHIAKNLRESKTTIINTVPLLAESMYHRIWSQAAKDPQNLKKLRTGIKISGILGKIGIDVRRKFFKRIIDSFGGELKMIICGGAAIDPKVAKGFRSLGIQCVQGYGLTECSPILTLNRDVDYKDDAAGLPLPRVELAIDVPGKDGIGEIIARGPNVMLGYYENPEATAAVLRQGWFHTGDAGYIDNDGFLHITGREKNVIVTKNGKNIYPEELETLLGRSPYIKEVMVYGKEDSSGETEVAALIYPDMDAVREACGGNEPSPENTRNLIDLEIRNINRNLVLYKYIRHYEIRDNEFQKTSTKKIKRYLELKG